MCVSVFMAVNECVFHHYSFQYFYTQLQFKIEALSSTKAARPKGLVGAPNSPPPPALRSPGVPPLTRASRTWRKKSNPDTDTAAHPLPGTPTRSRRRGPEACAGRPRGPRPPTSASPARAPRSPPPAAGALQGPRGRRPDCSRAEGGGAGRRAGPRPPRVLSGRPGRRRQSREPAAEPGQKAASWRGGERSPGRRSGLQGARGEEGAGRGRASAPGRRDLPRRPGRGQGSAARRAAHVPRDTREPPAGAGSAASCPRCSPAGHVALFAPSEWHRASGRRAAGARARGGGRGRRRL